MMLMFELGAILMSPGVQEKLLPHEIAKAVRRHVTGDWGDLDEHDKAMNDRALIYRNQIFSAYRSKDGVKFYVITESDRSVTTLLLPSEY